MVVRREYPPGVPCWIDLTPPDPEAATTFYGGLFDWEFEDRVPPEAPGHYFIARLDGQVVAAIGSPTGAEADPIAWTTYIAVEDADDAASKVRGAGGKVLAGPMDVPGAGRWAACADPAGATFAVWQPMARKGVELVNAPGSWNFSNLETPDPEGARAFYGAVFGWVARPVSFGSDEATMWCVPGYGDFLATIDPDLRERHADAAVPEGFSDAIGWMGATDAAAGSWGITFSVDDVDAVVERAEKLEGRVVVPAFDAGASRLAVLADPSGATFTVSHYRQ